MSGCAVTFESDSGDTHRVGFFWESEKTHVPGEVQYKTIRTAGMGLDTTQSTGGFFLGYKEWVVVQLQGDAQVDICVASN